MAYKYVKGWQSNYFSFIGVCEYLYQISWQCFQQLWEIPCKTTHIHPMVLLSTDTSIQNSTVSIEQLLRDFSLDLSGARAQKLPSQSATVNNYQFVCFFNIGFYVFKQKHPQAQSVTVITFPAATTAAAVWTEPKNCVLSMNIHLQSETKEYREPSSIIRKSK